MPEVLVIFNIIENGQPLGLGDAGHFWHADLSYKDQPRLDPMLHAQELPAALLHAVRGARAEHSYLVRYEELRRRNPCRPALFESEHFTTRIVGIPDDESRALLAELFAHSVRPEHVYRHRWASHDMVFWDNRSLMHLAGGTSDHVRRKLYRTTIEGDVPF